MYRCFGIVQSAEGNIGELKGLGSCRESEVTVEVELQQEIGELKRF
jgi:hypothetical protein